MKQCSKVVCTPLSVLLLTPVVVHELISDIPAILQLTSHVVLKPLYILQVQKIFPYACRCQKSSTGGSDHPEVGKMMHLASLLQSSTSVLNSRVPLGNIFHWQLSRTMLFQNKSHFLILWVSSLPSSPRNWKYHPDAMGCLEKHARSWRRWKPWIPPIQGWRENFLTHSLSSPGKHDLLHFLHVISLNPAKQLRKQSWKTSHQQGNYQAVQTAGPSLFVHQPLGNKVHR